MCDNVSERNIDVNMSSTAQQSTSQPFLSKSFSNKPEDHQTATKQTPKKSPIKSAMSRNKQLQRETGCSSQTFTNSFVSSIDNAVQNLNINNETGDRPKSKNAKKKQKAKLKQLTIPTPVNPLNRPQPSQFTPGYSESNEYPSLHECFAYQISPLYANSNSRYLENLSHHPQYQLSHNIAGTHLATSLPNTPFLIPQRPKSVSIPNSPISHTEYMSPKCLQNVMQHPLLCQTYNANFKNRINSSLSAVGSTSSPTETNTPKHKKNKKKTKSVAELKFDAYLSPEEVEVGLRENLFIEGVLRINPKLFQHSYVPCNDRSEQDILIEGIKNRNRALEGDIVIVQMIESENDESNEEEKQKKGKVVFIKEKMHNRTCIGNLKLMPDNNRQRALFVPRDNRIPRLNIPFTSWPDNFYQDAKDYENTLFLAKIGEWVDTRFAMGTIVCNIGQTGDMVSETKAILAQMDLDIKPFGPEVQHLYPQLDYEIPDEEFAIREDCRKLCLFSIDPSNCRDIDDAVSCRELENGNYEVGVHIADVAHFLTENTILDKKVADKATTIYLVEKAYHMLPDDLCMLCSLFPGVDKLAFSVFWEITKDAKILSHRFAKTVINSCSQLSYDHAQDILDDKENSEVNFPGTYNGYFYKDIQTVVKTLGSIASTFRKNRFDSGALTIDQPKVSFHLNAANGLPDNLCIYQSKESHQLIEEFMLLANMTVADRIREDHPKLAFLRCHPPPSGFMLKQLAKSLKPMGIELDISSAGDLHRSLQPHVGPSCMDQGKVMVLNMLCAKPMTRAKYFCADGCDDDDFRHYALNVPLYTHFTSPIRRYADIMVHR